MKIYVVKDLEFGDIVCIGINYDAIINYLLEISLGEFHYGIYVKEVDTNNVISIYDINNDCQLVKEIITE